MDPIVRFVRVGGAALLLVPLLAGCEAPAPRGADAPDTASPGDGTASQPALDTLLVHFTLNESPLPIERVVPRTSGVLRQALEQQLAGPTAEEREALGVFSWFSEETAGMLRGVNVDETGRAVVDFEDFSALIPNASTSLGSATLLGELNATVFQFPNVRSVEYRFEGSCDAFANWLQFSCESLSREQIPAAP
jgi:hypothetical protein